MLWCSPLTRNWWILSWLDTPLSLYFWISPAFDVLLPSTLPVACCVPCAVHTLFQQTTFPSVGADSVFHWQTDQHKSLSSCMKVCTWYVDVHDRECLLVTCCNREKSPQSFHWRSPCVQILPIFAFEFSCNVTWSAWAHPQIPCSCQSTVCRLEWPGTVQRLHVDELFIHSEVTQVFLFRSLARVVPRQFCAGDVINAQDTLVPFSNFCLIACFSRLRLSKPSMVDVHNFSSSWSFLSSSVPEFSDFLTFPSIVHFLTASITMLFKILTIAKFFQILFFLLHPSRRSPLCHSWFDLLRNTCLWPLSLLQRRCIPADHLVTVFCILASFRIADSLFKTRTTMPYFLIWPLMSCNSSFNAAAQIPPASPSLIVTTYMLGWVFSRSCQATVRWLWFFMLHPSVFLSDSPPRSSLVVTVWAHDPWLTTPWCWPIRLALHSPTSLLFHGTRQFPFVW